MLYSFMTAAPILHMNRSTKRYQVDAHIESNLESDWCGTVRYGNTQMNQSQSRFGMLQDYCNARLSSLGLLEYRQKLSSFFDPASAVSWCREIC